MLDLQTRTPMTMAQAVEYTGYSRTYLYQLISKGKIPYYKPDGAQQGKVFFSKEELNLYIFGNRISTTEELHRKADNFLNGIC